MENQESIKRKAHQARHWKSTKVRFSLYSNSIRNAWVCMVGSYPSEMYHRPRIDLLFQEILGRCRWGFYTAVCCSNAINIIERLIWTAMHGCMVDEQGDGVKDVNLASLESCRFLLLSMRRYSTAVELGIEADEGWNILKLYWLFETYMVRVNRSQRCWWRRAGQQWTRRWTMARRTLAAAAGCVDEALSRV